MNTGHVIIDSKTQEFVCCCCKMRYLPNLPAPITLYIAMTQAFVEEHRHCKVKIKE